MTESRTSKAHVGRGSREGGGPPSLLLVLVLSLLAAASLGPAPLPGQVLLTQEEALELAFPPPAEVERRSAFLNESQLTRIRSLAGDEVSMDQSVVTHYVGRDGDRPVGVAYFDVHRVRTMREVVMVLVSPESTVERIEVLRFAEPPEYMASEEWIAQLEGQTLEPDLRLGRDIINMTGATLTSEALTRAARRVLAIHRVLDPFGRGASGADAAAGSAGTGAPGGGGGGR